MAYRKFNPLNTDGVLYSDAGQVVNSTTVGTSGQVLTSNGAGVAPTFQAVPGGSITIAGDTGSATGSTINLHGTPNSGSSVSFSASAATVNLNVTDSNSNTLVGNNAGNNAVTGTDCTALGKSALHGLGAGTNTTAVGFQALAGFGGNDGATAVGSNAIQAMFGQKNTAVGSMSLGSASASSGALNTAIGSGTLSSLTTGSFNVAIGTAGGAGAGSAYTGSETGNILINSLGIVGESNTLRIGFGTGGGGADLDQSFIDGISGVTVANAQPVLMDTTTGQLGTVSVAGRSAWQVTLSANIPDVTGDATNYQLPYDTVIVDQGSNYNVGTATYTIPFTGVYQINIQYFMYLSSGVNTSTVMIGTLSINGGATVLRIVDSNAGALGLTGNGEFITGQSFMYNATQGDTLEVFADVGGGTKNIGVAGFGNPTGCTFSGFLIS